MAKGNFIDATSIVESLNKVFQQQEQIVKEVSVAVSGLASNYGKLPSNLNASVKAYNDSLQKQATVTNSLNKAVQHKNQVTAQEIVNQNILNQNAKRHALANSQLAGAYRNLSAQVAQASERYQNLIVRGRLAEQTQRQYNKELRVAEKEFTTLNNRVLQADKAVGRFNRNVGNYPQLARGLGDLMSAFGIVGGISLFASIATDIFQTTKELESLQLAMKQVIGTQEQLAETNAFLTRISEAYGVEIKSLTKQFTQFYVSAKDKISANEIQQIFESITKAAGAMGLSVDSQQRAFLALNQMMSKGTIQAEELRGQLGEALPGAFGIMAKAVGVTEQELGKMMKNGELLASEVLPKFAIALEQAYGVENLKRVESLNAATTRLSNSWTAFIGSFSDSDGGNFFSKFLQGGVNYMTSLLNITTTLLTSNEKLRKSYLESQKAMGEEGAKNVLSSFKNSQEREEYANEALAKTRKELAKNTEEFNRLKLENQRLSGVQGRKMTVEEIKEKTLVIEKNEKLIKNLNEIMYKQVGYIEGLKNSLVEEKKGTKVKQETNTEIEKEVVNREKLIKTLRGEYAERTKIEKPQVELKDGFLQTLKNQKQAFEEIQKTISSTSQEYQNYQKLIDGVQNSIDLIENPEKVIKSTGVDDFMRLYGNKNTKEVKEFDDALKNIFKTISNDTLSNFGFSSLIPIFDNTFSEMWDKADTFTEKFAVAMKYTGDVAIQAYAMISQANQANYEQSFRNLELQKENALMFAGESATAREEIERQYDEKRRVIQRRQAEAQKNQAMFQMGVQAIQGSYAAYLSQLVPGDPTSIIRAKTAAAITLGLGLANLAMVASQQIPQFAKGTENAPEGWAWTQEQGREIITDRHGKIKSTGTDSGAKLTYLNRGDKVLTNSITEQLNNQLISNGIAPIIINNENDIVGKKIDNLAKIIANKESVIIQDDANGRNYYQRKRGETVKIMNSRINIKGYDV